MALRLLTTLGLAGLLLLALAPRASTAALGEGADVDGRITRRVTIDGRAVDISVMVRAVGIVNSPNVPGPSPTSIQVDLVSADDQDLPDVTAVRVKLERVRAPARVYRSPLFPVLTFAADPRQAGYAANLTSFRAGALLKATVTVETSDGPRSIPIGQLRVGQGPIPFVPPSLTD